MPAAMCHAMWQWKNQLPGFEAVHWITRSSCGGTITVSFSGGSIRFSSPGLPSTRYECPCRWKGCDMPVVFVKIMRISSLFASVMGSALGYTWPLMLHM